jgi:hypothetical protein
MDEHAVHVGEPAFDVIAVSHVLSLLVVRADATR